MNLHALFRLLLVAVVSCAAVPAQAAVAAARPASAAVAAGAANVGEVGELKDRVKELEVRERQGYALEMEGQRKQVDWWLSFLGIMLAGLAIFVTVAGIAIPYVIARKNKEIFDLDKKAIEQDKAQVRTWRDEIEKLKQTANDDAKDISEKRRQTLEVMTNKATSEDVMQTAKETARDETAAPLLRLRAKAVEASRPENAQEAYTLWKTLAELDENDAIVQFNAGYWADVLSKTAQDDEKLYWLRSAGRHYAQSFAIKPGIHEVANNWGNALAKEAEVVFARDPAVARTLWQRAREKYQQALATNPDQYKTVRNWGTSLLKEVEAISSSKAEHAKQLLDQAEHLFLAYVDAAPAEIAYGLACVYGRRGDALSCLKWLNVCQKHKTLESCEHMRNDPDFDSVRDAPEFIAWLQQACPSHETAATQGKKA